MGNVIANKLEDSILPKTKCYTDTKLEFTEQFNGSCDLENKSCENNSILPEIDTLSEMIRLENRIEKIETTTLENLTLISNDIHTLYKLIHNLEKK